MTPHNCAKKEDIANIVIMPGDPKRAKFITENYLEDYKLVNDVRGMLAYTGFYKGKRITVMASGMGMPSIGIYSYELFKFYDVDVVVYADGEEIGTLKELTGKETVIMTGYEAAPAGYKRVYKVMSYHAYIDENGEEQVEIVEIENADFDEETGAIIFDADRFSTYLVAYKDVFAPSVNTGVFTGEGGSANASVILPVILATVIIILAGAFKFAKK